MILIFSKSWNEGTTELVIEWLISKKAKFHRLNGDEFRSNHELENNKFIELEPLIEETNICWFRRWNDPQFSQNLLEDTELSNHNYRVLHNFLDKEASDLSHYLWYLLRDKEWLSNPTYQIKLNKLKVLNLAKEIGLSVPDTIATTFKNKVKSFKKTHYRIISKAISDPIMFLNKDIGTYTKTVEVTEEDLNSMPERFHLSLFQNLIEKDIELRVFYFHGNFYSMAIFSQLDTRTQVDFRNYNFVKPNRTVPYLLPEYIKEKLHQLMSQLHLDTGSIDLVKDKNGDYIFLEINPIGQFGMVSQPCNYKLEKIVAEYLISRNEKVKRQRKQRSI